MTGVFQQPVFSAQPVETNTVRGEKAPPTISPRGSRQAEACSRCAFTAANAALQRFCMAAERRRPPCWTLLIKPVMKNQGCYFLRRFMQIRSIPFFQDWTDWWDLSFWQAAKGERNSPQLGRFRKRAFCYSHSLPETVTQTILYRSFSSDYRDCLDYPRITVYHNSCCRCVIGQQHYLAVILLL